MNRIQTKFKKTLTNPNNSKGIWKEEEQASKQLDWTLQTSEQINPKKRQKWKRKRRRKRRRKHRLNRRIYMENNCEFLTFKRPMNLSSVFICVCFSLLFSRVDSILAVLFLRSSKFKRQFSRQQIDYSKYSNKAMICKAFVSAITNIS